MYTIHKYTKSTSNPAEQYKRARIDIAIAETQASTQQSVASFEPPLFDPPLSELPLSDPPLLLQVKRGRGRPRLTEKEKRKEERKKE